MTINDIQNCLNNCLKSSYVFENEAQFRDALVEELRISCKNYDIKIEVHFEYNKKKYLCFDIVAKENNTGDIKVAELKYYKNDYNQRNILGKSFNITNNFTRRISGYNKDIDRIKDNNYSGYAIFLAYNDNKSMVKHFKNNVTTVGNYDYVITQI